MYIFSATNCSSVALHIAMFQGYRLRTAYLLERDLRSGRKDSQDVFLLNMKFSRHAIKTKKS